MNLPRALFRGVGAGDGLGDGSLILTPIGFLPTTFWCFFGGGVAAALHLPSQFFGDSALGSADESQPAWGLGQDQDIHNWHVTLETGDGSSEAVQSLKEHMKEINN
jgi:hypothetical protein